MLLAMSWTQWLLSVVLIFVCLFLMLVILLQRGRGGGIASAFGGGGGSGAFGAKTGDVFTWITVVVAGVFVVLAVVANYAFDESKSPVAEAPPVAESLLPTSETKPELTPITIGEDGQPMPITIEQLPSGMKGVTITPVNPPAGAAQDNVPAASPPAPAPTQPPPASQPPAEKPKEEPATP